MVKTTLAWSVTMTSRVSCNALVAALCSVALASPAAAQLKVELGATVGLYSPAGSFAPVSVHSTDLPNGPGDLSGATFGAQLRLWVIPRLGLELAGSTASSTVGSTNSPNGLSRTTSARVSTGTAQLLFRLTNDASRARIWLGAGAGEVQHGGQTYEVFGTPVNFAGVFSAGSAIRIIGGLSADVGVTSMIYNFNAHATQAGESLSERGRQVDMVFRTGLSYALH